MLPAVTSPFLPPSLPPGGALAAEQPWPGAVTAVSLAPLVLKDPKRSGTEAAASTASEQSGNSDLQEPHVGELSSSCEEDEGLKDTVGSFQVDTLLYPSGCSNMPKLSLDVNVLPQGEEETGRVCSDLHEVEYMNIHIGSLNLLNPSFIWVPLLSGNRSVMISGIFSLISLLCAWKNI